MIFHSFSRLEKLLARLSSLRSTPPTNLTPSLLTMSTALNLFRPAVRQFYCLNVFSRTAPQFSTSAILQARRHVNRDRSKLRGVSAIRRQPKKIALAAAKFDLPEPELDMSKHEKVKVDPEHGLWGFFLDKKALPTPDEDSEHGT